eukprot:1157740-Pelagomonas_calceolata.AAC.2
MHAAGPACVDFSFLSASSALPMVLNLAAVVSVSPGLPVCNFNLERWIRGGWVIWNRGRVLLEGELLGARQYRAGGESTLAGTDNLH